VRRCLLPIILISGGGAMASEPLSTEQQEVWAGEEAYWSYVANRDVDGFMTLWDERFIGWPCDASVSENYEDLRSVVPDWFGDIAADGNETTIEPEAVIVDEQFAITYVAATTITANETGAAKAESIKIVHTWRRTDDGWKIIGGMCGPLER
jgi:ketosteroid isomerase-like protein